MSWTGDASDGPGLVSCSLDGKRVFRDGFAQVRSKLEARAYTSVAAFSTDFGAVFSAVIGSEVTVDRPATANAPAAGEGSAPGPSGVALTAEQKDIRRLAKRIIKTVQGALEEAVRKEAELGRKPFEKELRELEMFLDHGILSRRDSTVASIADASELEYADALQRQSQTAALSTPMLNGGGGGGGGSQGSLPGDGAAASQGDNLCQSPQVLAPSGALVSSDTKPAPTDATAMNIDTEAYVATVAPAPKPGASVTDDIVEPSRSWCQWAQPDSRQSTQDNNYHHHHPHHQQHNRARPLLSPLAPVPQRQQQQQLPAPLSASVRAAPRAPDGASVPATPTLDPTEDLLAPLRHGGIAWYMEPFDPLGTVIQEERWTGREVLRGMSEELSELDEEELAGLVDDTSGFDVGAGTSAAERGGAVAGRRDKTSAAVSREKNVFTSPTAGTGIGTFFEETHFLRRSSGRQAAAAAAAAAAEAHQQQQQQQQLLLLQMTTTGAATVRTNDTNVPSTTNSASRATNANANANAGASRTTNANASAGPGRSTNASRTAAATAAAAIKNRKKGAARNAARAAIAGAGGGGGGGADGAAGAGGGSAGAGAARAAGGDKKRSHARRRR